MKKITLKTILFLLIGTACNFLQAQTTTDVYYDDFRYYGNSGFTAFDDSALLGTLAENANSNTIYTSKLVPGGPTDGVAGQLGYLRPANNSGARTDAKDPSAIRFSGSTNAGAGTNYKGETWLVTDAQDISNHLDLSVTFATKNAFEETGGAGAETGTFKVLIKFDYTDGDNPGAVATWIDVTASVTDVKETFGNDGTWAVSKLDLSSYITTANSNKFALAFQYKFSDGGTYSTTENRNGTYTIADVRFQSTSYTETLENSTTAIGTFADETYTGDHGFEWTLVGKPQTTRITGNTTRHAYMAKLKTGMTSGTINTGIRSFTATVQAAFANGSDRTAELLVNDVSKGTIVISDTGASSDFTVRNIDVSGDVVIKLKNLSPSYSIAFDDLSWTSYTGTISSGDVISKDNITIFPNPANDVINIKNTSGLDISNVILIDLTGKIIYNSKSTNAIDVSNVSKGVYILKITSSEEGTISTKVIIN